MVGPSKTPAFWSSSCRTRRRMKVFVGMMNQLYGVDLPFPDLTSGESSFKEFCSALLERRRHLWDIVLQRLSSDSRMGVSMSLFLFRKVGPSSRPCPLALLEKVARPSPSLPEGGFREFLKREVNHLMPVGWDRDYVQKSLTSVIPTKSYSELNGDFGCSRDWFLRNTSYSEWSARQSFIEVALASVKPFLTEDDCSRLTVVSSGGKFRALSIAPVRMNYLRPLHTAMYDYMSRYKWLLRGDAKASSFKGFETRPGEVFCSGDYESATDNLNQEVQKEILRLVLQNARNVPVGVQVSAMRSFSLLLSVSDRDGNLIARKRQQSGQMMGNLLSFPLLCLTNYITFRWLTMDLNIPVRVNGDDIVFRARQEVVDRWMNGVSVSGLTLSRGKTMVNGRYFTLNSTLFKSTLKRSRVVAFVRSKALFGVGDDDSVASLRGRFRSFITGYGSARATPARAIFLRVNSGWIRKSCRSLNVGLGIRAQRDLLEKAGLLMRELRYLSCDEKPLPNLRTEWGHLPDGYEIRYVSKDEKKRRMKDLDLCNSFLEAAWKERMAGVSWKSREETYCYGLDLSDAIIIRKNAWTTQMVKLGRFLEKFYGKFDNLYRWIKTRFTKVDWSNLRKVGVTNPMVPCWFSKNESKSRLRFEKRAILDDSGYRNIDVVEYSPSTYSLGDRPTSLEDCSEESSRKINKDTVVDFKEYTPKRYACMPPPPCLV